MHLCIFDVYDNDNKIINLTNDGSKYIVKAQNFSLEIKNLSKHVLFCFCVPMMIFKNDRLTELR